MKAAIQAIGIHNTIPRHSQPELAQELKTLTGQIYRRTDHFIQLAILGAHKALQRQKTEESTALFITSGLGNVSVFSRIAQQRLGDNLLPRPVDFINLLSNSAGFYVASHLGLGGTNHFMSHHRFPVQMALLAALARLQFQSPCPVLVGGVDEYSPDEALLKQLLGVQENTVLGEGSNWMLLSPTDKGSIATLSVEPSSLDSAALHCLLSKSDKNTSLAFGRLSPETQCNEIMHRHPQCCRYRYEKSCGYYETLPLYVMNSFLADSKGTLIHIDEHEGAYMVMSVRTA